MSRRGVKLWRIESLASATSRRALRILQTVAHPYRKLKCCRYLGNRCICETFRHPSGQVADTAGSIRCSLPRASHLLGPTRRRPFFDRPLLPHGQVSVWGTIRSYESDSEVQANLKCKICASGSLVPLNLGGRPGDKPQRVTSGQCDKCGSILAVNRGSADSPGGGFAVQSVRLG